MERKSVQASLKLCCALRSFPPVTPTEHGDCVRSPVQAQETHAKQYRDRRLDRPGASRVHLRWRETREFLGSHHQRSRAARGRRDHPTVCHRCHPHHWLKDWRLSTPRRGSDSNGEKNNDLQDDSCSETLSQTMVIEKPQDLRVRPRDFAGSWFSITVLECDFSNQPLGDGFREGKTRWNWGLRPSSLFFSPLLSEPSRLKVVHVY